MITFNNIVSKFQEFCDDHFFIKTFTYGSPADVDLEKFEEYPLLHLVYTGGDYNSPKAKTYNLEVYILSLPPSKADKVDYQKENISNAEQVAEDILADIQNGGNIFQFGFHYDLVNASVTPLEETQSNALAGCLLDIAISVPYTYDSCNAPLMGVEPEGSDTPAFKARGLLRVRELDGSPDVLSVATINVPDGSLTDDGDGEITLTFGGEATRLTQTVKNVSGGELTKGTPVHAVVDGTSGNIAHVIAARADTPSAMPATFVLNETLADEAEGDAIITGLISGVDTSAFSPGDVLYVNAAGGYTNIKPQGASNLVQNLGIVIKSHASNGSGIVYGAGRSNDVPNLSIGHFFIGGQQTYGIESLYAFPTTEPNDGEVLVYNDDLDRFDAVPIPDSSGQVSTFTLNSTNSTVCPTGTTLINFGGINDISVTQSMRAGWSLGVNSPVSATQINAAPTTTGSTFTISLEIEVLIPTGGAGLCGVGATSGYLTEVTMSAAILGDGTYQTITMSDTANAINIWQLTNSIQFQLFHTAASSAFARNAELTITMNHG